MNKLKSRFWQFVEHLGQERLRRSLLQMDERQLADAGFSRERLRQGVKAWPWRTSQEDWSLRFDPNAQVTNPLSEVEVRQAVTELRLCSDKELDDLGIGRGDIEYVVRHGRTHLDDKPKLAA